MSTADLTPGDIIRVPEAAQLLRVSRSALYKLLEQGGLPHFRIGDSIRLRKSTLAAWCAAEEAKAAAK